MPSVTVKQFAGLFTSPNPFSLVPEGALAAADEVVATTPGEIEPRRGRKPSVQFTADRAFPLPVTLRLLTTSRLATNPVLYDQDLDTQTTVTRSSGNLPMGYPYAADARAALQAAAGNGNLYLATSTGLQAVPGVASPRWRAAGLPPPVIQTDSIIFGSVLSFAQTMPNNRRRVYRATIAMYDELGNLIESQPCDPFPFDNTSGVTACPGVQMYAPLGLPTGCFVRLYRSLEVPVGTVASDEMFLVQQQAVTFGLVAPNTFSDTSISFSIFDQSVDSMLTVPLYTNPRTGDGFGLGGANVQPPAASAIAYFKQRMYFARCSFRQTLRIQVIGTGLGGINTGDVIRIDGVNLTAGGDFQLLTVPGQPAQNIDGTARSLVNAINGVYTKNVSVAQNAWNRPTSRQLRARYVSLGGNDFGRIVIERIFPSPLTDDPGIPFSLSTSGAAGSIIGLDGTLTSSDNYAPGGVAWSKINQPEAVPAINFQNVGDPQAICLGFSVHRDSLFLYKEDGVWLVKDDGGPQPTFSLLDASVNVIAPSSIAVLDNVAYCLTARGPLQVSEQGTWPVGEAIRADIVKLINASPNKCANAYGVGYDSDRLYVLGLPAGAGEGACSVQYVLRVPDVNSPPRWTRWLLPGTTHGCVIPVTNKLALAYGTQPIGNNVLGAPTGGVLVERKGGVVSTDYVDYIGNVACPALSTASQLVFPQDVHLEIQRGDKFWYNPGGAGTKVYEITVTGVAGATVTLDGSYPFAGGTLTYLRAIQSRLRLLPITGGEPTAEKQWGSVQAYFDYFDADSLQLKIDSETSPLETFSEVFSDPRNSNTGGQIQGNFPGPVAPAPSPPTPCGQIQWLRNCRDVLLRGDPGKDAARSARLGVEILCANARSSFRLAAISAWIGEVGPVGGR